MLYNIYVYILNCASKHLFLYLPSVCMYKAKHDRDPSCLLMYRPDITTCFSSLSRYQIFVYFTCAFQNISCGIHYLASVFMTMFPKHTCRPPGNVSRILFHNTSLWRLDDIWTLFPTGREDYVVVQLEDGEVWELTRCYRFRRDNKSSLNYDYDGHKSGFSCLDGFIYDKSKWDNTVVTQWDLVCNREWFAKLIQPTFMFGVLLGALVFGYLSDR